MDESPSDPALDTGESVGKSSVQGNAADKLSAASAGALKKIQGAVDSLTHWGATGWAWMPGAPDQALDIEAALDGKVIGRAVADQMRRDLAKRAKGTGRYGFTLTFERALPGDSAPEVRALGPEGATLLSGAKLSSVEGHVDSLTSRGASGWAWMPSAPNLAVPIEAVLDGKVIGRAVADRMRKDVAASGRGSGRYGFRLVFDEPMTRDKKPQLRALGSGEPTLLQSAGGQPPAKLQDILGVHSAHADSPSLQEVRETHLRILAASGLFQPEWYVAAYPDLASIDIDPLIHYYDYGRAEGRRPNRYFDARWYLDRYPEVAETGLPPLVHYVLRGDTEGRQPSLMFNPAWYRTHFQLPDEYLALTHYLENCGHGTVSPLSEFDIEYYAAHYPDVIAAGVDPFYHYITRGYLEGRAPSEAFDGRWYSTRYLYGDSSTNPFLHWLQNRDKPGVHGKMPPNDPLELDIVKIRERGLLDEPYYLANNPDVAKAKVDPVWHYVVSGEREGRRPTPIFDPVFYLAANCDIRNAKVNSLVHFDEGGRLEGRLPAEAESERSHVPSDECVLFVGHDGIVAGAQIVLLDVIKWTFAHTNRRILIILLGPGDLVAEYSRYGRILVVQNVDEDEKLIRRFLVGESVNFIYANTVASGRFFTPAIRSMLGSSQVVAHIHELTNVIAEFEPEFRQLKDCARQWICASEVTREQLVSRWGVPASDAVAIHAFITPTDCPGERLEIQRAAARKELGLSSDDFIVIGSGTVSARKGPDIFVETALRAVSARAARGRIKFVWIGDGEDRATLIARVQANSASDEIIFVGFRRDANRLVAAADVFLLSSREDPFPLVCLEAARFAIPTVCVRGTTGITEFLGDDAGYVVESADPQKLAAQLLEISANTEERALRGRQAYDRLLSNYTADDAMLKIETCLWSGICKPAVTVIVPNYNHESFLPERLDSIFGQSIKNIQIVLLDDASSDKSVAVLRETLPDPRVQLSINETNSGSAFRQWAKGLSLALGDFIWVAESDDSCESHMLSALLSSTAHREVAIAFAATEIMTESGAPVPEALTPYLARFGAAKFDRDFVMSGAEFVRAGFGVLCAIVNASAAIIRRTLLIEALPHAQSFVMCGDWFIYLHCLKVGEVAYTARARNFFRRHNTSTVHRVEGTDVYFAERLRIANYVSENFRIPSSLSYRMVAELRGELDRFAGRFTFRADTFLANLRTALHIRRREPGGLRIALYIHGLKFSTGGIERVGSQIANYLSDCGHEITIFCNAAQGRPVYPLRGRVAISELDIQSADGQEALTARLQAGEFHVFIPMLSEHLFANAITAARRAAVRIIASEHNDPWKIEERWWNRADRQKYFSLCDGVHVLLPQFANSLDVDLRAKARVIPNGVDLNVFKPQSPSRRLRRIVTAGRLSEQKRLDVLIDAFALIAEQEPEWSLHIFGAGELEARLRSQVSWLSMEERVVFRGLSTHLEEEFNAAEFFVLPSEFEGFGIVIVEAMACGLPCIAFRDCNGPNAIIRDGREGLLVEERSPAALAHSLRQMIADKVTRDSMRVSALLRARDFDLRLVEQYWETYICSLVGAG
jgi:glycosyltransferase involved in cell wall biosynthesis